MELVRGVPSFPLRNASAERGEFWNDQINLGGSAPGSGWFHQRKRCDGSEGWTGRRRFGNRRNSASSEGTPAAAAAQVGGRSSLRPLASGLAPPPPAPERLASSWLRCGWTGLVLPISDHRLKRKRESFCSPFFVAGVICRQPDTSCRRQSTRPLAASIRCMLLRSTAMGRASPSRAPALGLTRPQAGAPARSK